MRTGGARWWRMNSAMCSALMSDILTMERSRFSHATTTKRRIMDTAYSTGHCDGIVSPQGLDKARAYDWYNMRSVPMGSIQNVSYQIFRYYFTDRNYAESNYAETVQRWDGAGTWVDV